ncbi:DM13 domain-containing protein [Hoeflea alexandrii]|uniref:DM13 domain-containing protein n=1 Tax=Hoeflea alexandrii TaxID=288436 RepID=UPI0022B035D1|nr:DM13 domain-containing protein [Hoeflea alexandrii]MCZ4290398.1 DM13 domain-containing protein [Hoeflea alexandrii]
MRWIIRIITHSIMLAAGFALGIYLLPIITAPPSPDQAMLEESARSALYTGEFRRDLKGSDFLHWGEGTVSVSANRIAHRGSLAPGPDYKLYLVPEFVEDEEQFEAVRSSAIRLGDIKTFDGFLVEVPPSVDIKAYTTVLVWCETFGEFISAAKYR